MLIIICQYTTDANTLPPESIKLGHFDNRISYSRHHMLKSTSQSMLQISQTDKMLVYTITTTIRIYIYIYILSFWKLNNMELVWYVNINR